MTINPAFWKNRRVLITGHTGFKGSWLLVWLKQLQAEVWGYSLEPSPNPNLYRQIDKTIKFTNTKYENIGDINNLKNLKLILKESSPEIVFHLAAQPLVRESYKNPIETWNTNVIGTLNLLEGLKDLGHKCAVVVITTDKVYSNKEWLFSYRENDSLGGHDPYSASKAAAEIAVSSWRESFCGNQQHQTPHLRIATARAGNVIGGGDWAIDRIVPDVIKALLKNEPVKIRNPKSIRPWQHVLDPLHGYLMLAEYLTNNNMPCCEAFNFGPSQESNLEVCRLVDMIFKHWPGKYAEVTNHISQSLHESNCLTLQSEKALKILNWSPNWGIEKSIEKTILWYMSNYKGESALHSCLSDIHDFNSP